MNKEREIDGIKIVVNEEQYEAYKGTLQDKIEKQSKYIEMLQNNIEKLVEEKIKLQDRINKAIEYIQDNSAFMNDDEWEVFNKKDLLDILKGDNK